MSKHDLSDILDTAKSHVPDHAHLPDLSELPPVPPTTPPSETDPTTCPGLPIALSHLDTALTHTDVTLPDITSHHDFLWH